jgi:hypothetical protein
MVRIVTRTPPGEAFSLHRRIVEELFDRMFQKFWKRTSLALEPLYLDDGAASLNLNASPVPPTETVPLNFAERSCRTIQEDRLAGLRRTARASVFPGYSREIG